MAGENEPCGSCKPEKHEPIVIRQGFLCHSLVRPPAAERCTKSWKLIRIYMASVACELQYEPSMPNGASLA